MTRPAPGAFDERLAVTVAALLHRAQASGIDRLDAQLLVAHHLGRDRSWVIAHGDAEIPSEAVHRLCTDLSLRAQGVPVAYLTGIKEFHRLRLRVTPAVLVPRPDTETLVEWAIELLDGPLAQRKSPSVVDLGTGSGAVALAVKAARGHVSMLATDICQEALAVARDNAAALGLGVDFALGHWWSAAGDQRFDLALSNPPYVAAGDPHLPALRHEPRLALESGNDGLDAVRAIVRTAASHLRGQGWLVLEHADAQQASVAALLEGNGFVDVAFRRDLAGLRRCTGGRLKT